MDLSTFPPVAFVLDAMYQLVVAIAGGLSPLAGTSATVLAIVTLTIVVRLVLVPASVAQVRAEFSRRRLAPAIVALRKRHANTPEQLQKAIMQLYTSEKVSPLAGCLPTLAQAPVLSAVYTLFVHQNLAGHANLLLTQAFAGIPLGANFFAAVAASVGGIALPQIVVFVLLLAVLALFVELTRRANMRWNAAGGSSQSASFVSVVGTSSPVPGVSDRMLRYLPFVSVVFAAIAPLAAAVYLVTSAGFTLTERALLRRLMSAGGR